MNCANKGQTAAMARALETASGCQKEKLHGRLQRNPTDCLINELPSSRPHNAPPTTPDEDAVQGTANSCVVNGVFFEEACPQVPCAAIGDCMRSKDAESIGKLCVPGHGGG